LFRNGEVEGNETCRRDLAEAKGCKWRTYSAGEQPALKFCIEGEPVAFNPHGHAPQLLYLHAAAEVDGMFPGSEGA
jgi:hypothetical protein